MEKNERKDGKVPFWITLSSSDAVSMPARRSNDRPCWRCHAVALYRGVCWQRDTFRDSCSNSQDKIYKFARYKIWTVCVPTRHQITSETHTEIARMAPSGAVTAASWDTYSEGTLKEGDAHSLTCDIMWPWKWWFPMPESPLNSS